MKITENKNINVTKLLLEKEGFSVRLNKSVKKGYRKINACGSTFSPSKPFIINGVANSLGMARVILRSKGIYYRRLDVRGYYDFWENCIMSI